MNSRKVSDVDNVSSSLQKNSTASFAGSKAACNEANDSKSSLLITSRAFNSVNVWNKHFFVFNKGLVIEKNDDEHPDAVQFFYRNPQ